MRLTLSRYYDIDCTDGEITDEQGRHICFSIELPDKKNKQSESCIPEGTYNFHKIFSQHLGWAYRLDNVPDRSLIDIHSANVAPELRGCIAVGLKQGTMDYQGQNLPAVLDSKKALQKLFDLVGTSGILTIVKGE